MAFGKYLAHHGLQDDKWLDLFAQYSITSEENLLSIKCSETANMIFENCEELANDDELKVLKKILGISSQSEQNQKPGIEQGLDSVGLECKYWAKVFSDKLGITSMEALEFVGGESYHVLEQFVHHQWEKKALRELLKLDKLGSSFKSQRQSQKEKLVERCEKARQLVQQLKDFHNEGKKRSDKQVEQVESEIREMLQIPPQSWIQKDDSLVDLISQVEARDRMLSGILQSREEVCDKEILFNASGGLALTGILLTGTVEEQMQETRFLLQVPQQVTLLGPVHHQNEWIEHFSSKSEEDSYIKLFNKLGYSVSALAQGGFGGFHLEGGAAYTKENLKDKTEEAHSTSVYCSTVKHSSMPLASFCFSDRDLRLSEDALSALKVIQTKITTYGHENSEVQKASEEFLRKFGSHANRGPLHFGGVYWLICSSMGLKESEVRVVKQLQNEVVNAHASFSCFGVGVSGGVNIACIKAKYLGTCSETTISQTNLEIIKTGGAPELSILTDWKTGLVAHNGTWSLIDRGTMLVPVWDIITSNHCTEFNKVTALVNVLHKTWERIAGMQIHLSALRSSIELAQLTEVVKQWNGSSSMSQEEVQGYLNVLVDVKRELIKQSMNPEAWPLIYLTQPAIQQFLKTVLDAQTTVPPPPEAAYVKQLVLQLLQKGDIKLDFPHREEFLSWLYGMQDKHGHVKLVHQNYYDLISFNKYLDLAVEKMREIQEKNSSNFGKSSSSTNFYDSQISSAIAKVIKTLLETLQESKYEYILMTTLIYPFIYDYCHEDYVIIKQMSLSDIEFLSKALALKRKEFIKTQSCNCLIRMQAFLFHLAIDMYCNEREVDISEEQLQKHVKFLQHFLGDDIQQEVKEKLACITLNTDWRKLQSDLSFMTQRTNLKQMRKQFESEHSLEHVLEGVPRCNRKVAQTEDDLHAIIQKSEDRKLLPEIQRFFDALNLTRYYPRKLTMQLALCIRQDTLVKDKCSDPRDLLFFILRKIMAYDYRCRSELYQGRGDDTDSDNSSCSSVSFSSAQSYVDVEVHPMDCLLGVLLCADDFLRQDLMSRLATCQLAIPFLLPDPFTNELIFPLWAMKTIVKEWKCMLGSQESVHERPITCHKAPIISFVRLSKHKARSKSNIMNNVVSNSNHEHFFHRNMEGGLCSQLLVDGTVDVCWYLPAGKQGDIFPDAIMFVNLHGDARKHSRQVKFLSQISFLTFVFISEEDFSSIDDDDHDECEMLTCESVLDILSNTLCGIVLLADNVHKEGMLVTVQKRLSSNVSIIKMEQKNDDKIKKKIRERINKVINDMWKQVVARMLAIDSEECIERAQMSGITIDEDSLEFKEGRRLANSLKEILMSPVDPTSNAKEAMLPLQGKNLWIKWASLDKEEHRQVNRGGEKVDKYGLRKLSEKKQVRQLQFYHVQNLTPLMESFIVSILTTSESPAVRNYFLQCVKLTLNNLSRKEITQLQNLYKEKRSKLLKLQKKKEVNQDAVKDCKMEIEELHEQMISASLGLEHLLRELGQVYEATQEFTFSEAEQFSRLPQAAAELLIDGYPLEIMDGDAAHVPSKWINAVLDEAKKKLKDPNVFILSVLGLQSTGKSTLMNTAFGLQFNVSAGRCTRGAFMQLLPIAEELRKEVNCDYVLVVDTEGLRAPELDSQKTQTHDNELATFVIGLADVTLINIFGEAPGDMDDILQTAVHAFIRMASVRLNPSCQFVHQNVGAILASGKGDMGRSRFKDKLDTMTCAAAKEENCEGQYEYFSEVIQFDDQEDVHHFPGLWRGDPPMAPVNTGYSEKAQLLVAHLLKLIKQKNMKGSSTQVSTFKTRVQLLWKALLNESFVFSFKNTMERKVYNSLEAEYMQWSWSFKRQTLEWQQMAENKIKSTKRKDELTKVQKTLLRDLPVFVMKVHDEIMVELTKYFEESKQREMLAQWQADAQNRLKRLAREEEDHGNDLCVQLTAAQMARTEVGDLNREYRNRMFVKLKEVFVTVETEIKQRIAESMRSLSQDSDVEAEQIEEEIKERELHDTFASLWEVWIEEIAQTIPRHHDNIDVERDAQKVLTETFRSHDTIIINELKGKNLRQWGQELKLPISQNHVALKKKSGLIQRVKRYFKSKPTELHMKEAEQITVDLFGKTQQFLDDKRNESYRAIHFQELLNQLMRAITDRTESELCELILTQEYRISVCLTACGFAVKQFEHKVEAERKQNDPIAYLEQELKKPLYDMFKSKYDHTSQDKATASLFCGILDQPIRRQVINSLGPDIVTDIVANNPCLKTKPALLQKILLDLGEQIQITGDLTDYFVYLKDPERSLKQWIKRFTFEHCEQIGTDNQTKLVYLGRDRLQTLVNFIGTCVQEVERKYHQCQKSLGLKVWLSDVCKSLEGQLQLDFDVFDTLTNEVEALNEVESFTEEVQAGLGKLCSDLHNVIEKYTTRDLEDWPNGPHNILFQQLLGCPECCPFCGEQCELLMKDHLVEHSVKFHRPSCLIGYRNVFTKVSTSDICTALVGTGREFRNKDTNGKFHPYKKYNQLYPKWQIDTDKSMEASSYWKWFLGNYGKELSESYAARPNDIFDQWKEHFEWAAVKMKLEKK